MPPWIFGWLLAESEDLQVAIGWIGAIIMLFMPTIGWFLMTYLYDGLPQGELSWMVWFMWALTIPASLLALITIIQRIKKQKDK